MALNFGAATTDRVALGSGLDNITAYTLMQWVFPTTRTNGRRWWSKGSSTIHQTAYWSFLSVGIEYDIPRATTAAAARTSNSMALNTWHCVAWTYDETDGPRIFLGTLTSPLVEATYALRTVGAGATTVDDGGPFHIGNLNATSVAFRGSIGTQHRWRRRMDLAELAANQFCPAADADCDVAMDFGFNGTGTQANLCNLGNGINGTVTGATVSGHVPLPPRYVFSSGGVIVPATAAQVNQSRFFALL